MGSAMDQTIVPRIPNRMTAATFEAKFTTFASADARTSGVPRSVANPTIRNVPVPGPKKPS